MHVTRSFRSVAIGITAAIGVAASFSAASEVPPARGYADLALPELIPETKVEPAYPTGAGIRCLVFVQAMILADGTVDVNAVRSRCDASLGFEETTLAAVRKWRYRPARKRGKPVDRLSILSFDFDPRRATGQHPTMMEQAIHEEYLGRALLLREDVKVRVVQERPRSTSGADPSSRGVIPSAFGITFQDNGSPLILGDRVIHPITLVTAGGVFHRSDYDEEETYGHPAGVLEGILSTELPLRDERPHRFTRPVIDRTVSATVRVILREGAVTRITDASETPWGILARLESYGEGPAAVLFRTDVGFSEPLDERRAAFSGLASRIFALPSEEAARNQDSWPRTIRDAVRAHRVLEGMNAAQVLLAWGDPVHISRGPMTSEEIWMFKRGANIMEQLRNTTNVRFAGGRVVGIDAGASWRSSAVGLSRTGSQRSTAAE